ncbi:hypothetical protein BJV77DRAFT_702124 [Russula vinacea]|nr:hypothetical protein BJV77DRAFT_702124 [Russula vinacea]
MPSEQYALEIYGHFVKLMHACAGIYIWEFVTTLDFEWEIYTGKRPWRWSFIVYVAARVLALACIILSLWGSTLHGSSIVMRGFALYCLQRGLRHLPPHSCLYFEVLRYGGGIVGSWRSLGCSGWQTWLDLAMLSQRLFSKNFPTYHSSANMASCSGSRRMVSSSADVCHHRHRRV